jgi:hypothetical protein
MNWNIKITYEIRIGLVATAALALASANGQLLSLTDATATYSQRDWAGAFPVS